MRPPAAQLYARPAPRARTLTSQLGSFLFFFSIGALSLHLHAAGAPLLHFLFSAFLSFQISR